MAGLSFGLPGSGYPNLAGQPPGTNYPGPPLAFGATPAAATPGGIFGTNMSAGELLRMILGGAAAGVASQPGAVGGIGRGFLAGQQMGIQRKARRLQDTELQQQIDDRQRARDEEAAQKAQRDAYLATVPPEERGMAALALGPYITKQLDNKFPDQTKAPTVRTFNMPNGMAVDQQWDPKLRDWTNVNAPYNRFAPPSVTRISTGAGEKPPPTETERYIKLVLEGDPNSPEVQMAFYQLKQPKWVAIPDGHGGTITQMMTPTLPPQVERKFASLNGGAAPPTAGSGSRGGVSTGSGTEKSFWDQEAALQPSSAAPAAPGATPPPGSTVGNRFTVGPVLGTNPGPGTGQTMTAGQQKDFTDRVGQLDNLDASLKQYKDILQKKGVSFMGAVGIPTTDNRAVSSAYIGLLIEMKNLYQLGALSGPDYELMKGSVTDPNSKDGVALGVDGLLEQLKVVEAKMASARETLKTQYPNAPGQSAAGKVPSPTTQAEYDALPKGTVYHHPDDPPGKIRTKQ